MSGNDQKSVLVTGATGVVGPSLIDALLRSGYKVRALCRAKDVSLPVDVEIVVGDLTDNEALRTACSGVQTVFHLAAKLHINAPSATLQNEYRKINVIGTKELIAASISGGVKRFIFFSTINVYGAGDGNCVFNEESPTNADGIYAKTKLEAESLVLESGIGVVVRLAAVYGSRMKGNWRSVVKMIKKGAFFIVGNGKNRRTLIHHDDVAAASILVAESAVAGEILNLTDGNVYSFERIVAAIAKAARSPEVKYLIPLAFIRPIAAIGDRVALLFGHRSPFVSTIEKMTEDVAVSGDKLRSEYGFVPIYDLDAGWRETLKND